MQAKIDQKESEKERLLTEEHKKQKRLALGKFNKSMAAGINSIIQKMDLQEDK
tara:strand:- start:77 stop:235 length:159 start_codon:yes stop_codon:yes gene_type:complete